MRVLIVDALNMFYRSYIVDPSLSAKGDPIGGTKGFLKSLQKNIREIEPDEVIVCWDGEGGSQKRKSINKEYKQGRKPIRLNRNVKLLTEEEEIQNKVWQQLRLIEYLNLMPIVQISLPHIEADDVIAYISQQSKYRKYQKVIVSSDKDFYQLCDKKTILLRPVQKEVVNLKTVIDKYGIHPKNFALARAIEGDKSDNLPGVKGVGLKTLAKRFPFLKESKEYSARDLIDVCKKQEKPLSIHQRLIEEEALVKENYKMMQLYNSIISVSSSQIVNDKIQHIERSMNKTEIMKMMITDGIAEYNWTDLWQNFNRIIYQSKIPF